VKEEEERITHYREMTFFMDEAEVMVEAALFLKIFGLKKNFDHVTNQYAVGTKIQDQLQQSVNPTELTDARVAARNQNNRDNQSNIEESSVARKTVPLVNIPNEEEKEKKAPQVYINYL
jgi:hypothetical protein